MNDQRAYAKAVRRLISDLDLDPGAEDLEADDSEDQTTTIPSRTIRTRPRARAGKRIPPTAPRWKAARGRAARRNPARPIPPRPIWR